MTSTRPARAAGSIEEGERLTQRREACSHRLDVEGDGRHRRRRYYDSPMAPARAAGSIEATTAATNSTNAETTTGNAPGIFKPPK